MGLLLPRPIQNEDVALATRRKPADLAADGNSLNGQINLSLPFLCGRNPVITGSLARQ